MTYPSLRSQTSSGGSSYKRRRVSRPIGCQVSNLIEYGWFLFDRVSLDHVAASCYSCSIKFSAFRRRHHCRVCGQIFCHACCSVFVPGEKLGKQSKRDRLRSVPRTSCSLFHVSEGSRLRICSYCHNYLQKYLQEQQDDGTRRPFTAGNCRKKGVNLPMFSWPCTLFTS